MATPAKKLGTLRPLVDGWEARIRIDRETRPSFPLIHFSRDEAGARERCNAMAIIARRLRTAGHAKDKIQRVLEIAAKARAGKAWDLVLSQVDQVCTPGATEPLSAAARVTVAELGRDWRAGELHRQYPDHVKLKKSAARDDEVARLYVDPVIGDRRVAELELDDVDEVMAQIVERHAEAFRERYERRRKDGAGRPPSRQPKSKAANGPAAPPASGTRRQIAQYMRRLLGLAVYPCRIRTVNPIPRNWLPRVRDAKAKECLYPDEDRTLLGARVVPLVHRLAYGFLAREGMRADELGSLEWRDVDVVRGRVDLDETKTGDRRTWDLDPGVARALALFRKHFCADAGDEDRVFVDADGVPLNVERLARLFRSDLGRAGVTRSKLFEKSATRQPIRAHDLRATFVTISLATGKTETWVADRTGHKSSEMINRYKRRARTWNLGALAPLDEAIPELAEAAAAKASNDARADHERTATVLSRGIPWNPGPVFLGQPVFLGTTALKVPFQNPPYESTYRFESGLWYPHCFLTRRRLCLEQARARELGDGRHAIARNGDGAGAPRERRSGHASVAALRRDVEALYGIRTGHGDETMNVEALEATAKAPRYSAPQSSIVTTTSS